MTHFHPSAAAARPAETASIVKGWPRLRAVSLAATASLALVACGGGGDDTEAVATTAVATPLSAASATTSQVSAAEISAGRTSNIASEPPADVAGEAYASLAGQSLAAETLAAAPVEVAPGAAPDTAPVTGDAVAVDATSADAFAMTADAASSSRQMPSDTAPDNAAKVIDITGPIVVLDPGFLTRFSAGEYLKASKVSQTDNLMGVAAAAPRVDPVTGGTYAIDPGALNIHYEEGALWERSASIVPDPAKTSNLALQFMLKSANVRDSAGTPVKGRVQMNAYAADQMRAKEIRFTTRMKLSSDVELMRSMTKTFDWLTISEWWNNGGWTGEDFPFRVSVNVTKPVAAAGSTLHFQAKAQVLNLATNKWDTTLWTNTNTAIEVPTGKWVTLEYHFRQGNSTEGRFYLAIVPDGGVRQVVFDVTGWTQHPSDPAPDGLSHLNPLKLYTSSAMLDHMNAAGGILSVLWDDLGFRLCAQRYTRGTSPCGPETFK